MLFISLLSTDSWIWCFISSISRVVWRISKCLIYSWYSKHFINTHFLPFSLSFCDGSLYVSTWLGHRMPRYLVKQLFLGVSVRVFPEKRLALELVDWVKETALPSLGGPQPTRWGPTEQKAEEVEFSLSAWLLELRQCFCPWTGTCT